MLLFLMHPGTVMVQAPEASLNSKFGEYKTDVVKFLNLPKDRVDNTPHNTKAAPTPHYSKVLLFP